MSLSFPPSNLFTFVPLDAGLNALVLNPSPAPALLPVVAAEKADVKADAKSDGKVDQVAQASLPKASRQRELDLRSCFKFDNLIELYDAIVAFDAEKRSINPSFAQRHAFNFPLSLLQTAYRKAMVTMEQYNPEDASSRSLDLKFSNKSEEEEMHLLSKIAHLFYMKDKGTTGTKPQKWVSAYMPIYTRTSEGGLKEFAEAVRFIIIPSNIPSNVGTYGQIVGQLKIKERLAKESQDNFRREVYYLELLQDIPNVCKILDGSVNDGVVYTELCNGGDLFDFCRSPETRVKFLSQFPQFILEMLESIVAIHHKRLVHADIKPENYLIHHDNEKHHIKVTDFGAMRHLHDPTCPDQKECSRNKIQKAKEETSLAERRNELNDIAEEFDKDPSLGEFVLPERSPRSASLDKGARGDQKDVQSRHLRSFSLEELVPQIKGRQKLVDVLPQKIKCRGEPSRNGTAGNYSYERLLGYLNADNPYDDIAPSSKMDDIASLGSAIYYMWHLNYTPFSTLAEFATTVSAFIRNRLGPRTNYMAASLSSLSSKQREFLTRFKGLENNINLLNCEKFASSEVSDDNLKRLYPHNIIDQLIRNWELDQSDPYRVTINHPLYDAILSVKCAYVAKLTELHSVIQRNLVEKEKAGQENLEGKEVLNGFIDDTQRGKMSAEELLRKYTKPLQELSKHDNLAEFLENKNNSDPYMHPRQTYASLARDSFAYSVHKSKSRSEGKE